MLALYRSGRQAEALGTYRNARATLVEELGIEPGEELRELERAILAHDPTLAGPADVRRRGRADAPRSGEGVAAAEPPVAVAQPARRRPAIALAGVVAVLALAALVVVLVAGGDDEERPAALTDDSHAVAVIDPATDEVTTAVSVGSNPGPLAFEPETRSLWVGNVDDETVTRIDTHPVRGGNTIAIGERPGGLAAGDGVVWVAGATRTRPFVSAHRVDARFDRAGEPIRVQSLADGNAALALDRSSLWVAPSNGVLTRLDPETGAVQRPRSRSGTHRESWPRTAVRRGSPTAWPRS